MTEELSLDNILGSDEIENLFSEEEETQKTPQNNDGDNSEENKNDKDNETTEVIDVDNLFTDLPESVGSGKENNTGIGKILILKRVRMLLPINTSTLPLPKP